jgi:hypothetical protein
MSFIEKLKNLKISKKNPNEHISDHTKRNNNQKKQKLMLSILNNIFVAILSAIFITSIIISAPMVEKVLPMISYNFNIENLEKRETYKLTSTQTDISILQKDIDLIKTKLNALGYKNITVSEIVEKTITSDSQEIELTNTPVTSKAFEFSISVQSTYDLSYASRAIVDKSDFKIMLPKDGIDPSNQEDQLAGILPENYNETSFTKESFRNIEIKELKDSSGSYSFFIVPKAFPKNAMELNKFLTENNGKYVGINLGEYVMPKLLQGEQANSLFIFIAQDEKEANFYKVMLNSKRVESQITLAETVKEAPAVFEINAFYGFGLIILMGMIFTIFVYFLKGRSQKATVQYFLTYFLTISILSSIAKVMDLNVLIWTIPIAALIFGFVLYINKYIMTFGTIVIFAIFGYFVLGMENSIILQTLYLLLAGLFMNYIVEIYIIKLKTLLIK